MLASTKPGSAAAPGREGDGEDGWGDPIGSPLTASARSRRNSSILARIASKSSAARWWARTTMTGNIVEAAEKQNMRLALITAPLPPSDGPARPLGLRWAAGTPAFLSPARSPGGCADDLRSPYLYPAPRNLGRI